MIELHLHLTPSMLTVQTAVLDLIDTCLKELRKSNPSVSIIPAEYSPLYSKCNFTYMYQVYLPQDNRIKIKINTGDYLDWKDIC